MAFRRNNAQRTSLRDRLTYSRCLAAGGHLWVAEETAAETSLPVTCSRCDTYRTVISDGRIEPTPQTKATA